MLCGTVYIVKAVLHEALPNCARLTMSAFIGKMPVASKLLRMVSTLNEDVQAAQNNGKKSPFLMVKRPWLWWMKRSSSWD
jgi:hypothetical protein